MQGHFFLEGMADVNGFVLRDDVRRGEVGSLGESRRFLSDCLGGGETEYDCFEEGVAGEAIGPVDTC